MSTLYPNSKPYSPGDPVEWTERAGQNNPGRRRGIIAALVQNGKSLLIRTGTTLIELNSGRVKRAQQLGEHV